MENDLFNGYDYEKEYYWNNSPHLKCNHFSKLLFLVNNNTNVDRIKDYIEKNPDEINKTNAFDWTALMLAAHKSNTTSSIDTVKLLLEHGADVNLKNDNGWTALMLAARYSYKDNNIDTVKLLIEYGANINHKNNIDWTILMYTARNPFGSDNFEIIKLLLKCGADPDSIDCYNKTFFDYIEPESEFGIQCNEIIVKSQMKQALATVQIKSSELLYHPDSWRAILIGIKQNINKKSFDELVVKYKWLFDYLGIIDDDTMLIKISDNYKFMD